MSEADLARDLHAVLTQVQQGLEVVVERDARAVAVIAPARPVRRTLSDLIRLAEEREKARGYTIPLDPDFAASVEEIGRSRKPWTPGSWE
jgi:antitoxin (DNA-binding transcriptional repressor) of toxin-antitoxin stability system